MASALTLQSSGQISLNDVRNLMPNTLPATNQSLRAFASHCGFSTPDNISDFYGYSISCSSPTSTRNFAASGGTSYETVTVSGGSASFNSTDSETWISTYDYGSQVEITCSENTNTSTRSGTVTVRHDDNNNCNDTITINQAAAVSYSLSISPTTVFINLYGGSASVTVTSLPTAGTWSIRSVSETWITASKINNTTLNISVSQQNPFEFHRLGNVILEHTSDSTVTKAVGVSQAGSFGM